MLNLLFASNALGPWIPMELCWKPDPAILDAKCCIFLRRSGPSFNAFNSCFCGPWPLQLFLRRAVGGHGRRLLRTASFWRPSSLVISVWGSGRIGFEDVWRAFWGFLNCYFFVWKGMKRFRMWALCFAKLSRCTTNHLPGAMFTTEGNSGGAPPPDASGACLSIAHNVTYALVSW